MSPWSSACFRINHSVITDISRTIADQTTQHITFFNMFSGAKPELHGTLCNVCNLSEPESSVGPGTCNHYITIHFVPCCYTRIWKIEMALTRYSLFTLLLPTLGARVNRHTSRRFAAYKARLPGGETGPQLPQLRGTKDP